MVTLKVRMEFNQVCPAGHVLLYGTDSTPLIDLSVP